MEINDIRPVSPWTPPPDGARGEKRRARQRAGREGSARREEAGEDARERDESTDQSAATLLDEYA